MVRQEQQRKLALTVFFSRLVGSLEVFAATTPIGRSLQVRATATVITPTETPNVETHLLPSR